MKRIQFGASRYIGLGGALWPRFEIFWIFSGADRAAPTVTPPRCQP